MIPPLPRYLKKGLFMEKTPAYLRVYNTLRSRIIEGDYAIGELLPAEPELERQFMVSRTTVRRAVEMLSREGLVEARQGKGTTVINHTTIQNINTVTSVSETLRHRGCVVETQDVRIDTLPANARVAAELQIPQGQPVVCIQRLKLADGCPVAYLKNYLLPQLVPNIEQHAGRLDSLYLFLEEYYGLSIDAARDRISARAATESDAALLRVPAGTALIYLTRICYSGGRVVGADHCRIVGSKYEFEVYMTGRQKF